MSSEDKPKTKFCKACDKRVKVIPKMFGVLLCPSCNIILDSDHPPYKDKK